VLASSSYSCKTLSSESSTHPEKYGAVCECGEGMATGAVVQSGDDDMVGVIWAVPEVRGKVGVKAGGKASGGKGGVKWGTMRAMLADGWWEERMRLWWGHGS
jgi:hypothetical protein